MFHCLRLYRKLEHELKRKSGQLFSFSNTFSANYSPLTSGSTVSPALEVLEMLATISWCMVCRSRSSLPVTKKYKWYVGGDPFSGIYFSCLSRPQWAGAPPRQPSVWKIVTTPVFVRSLIATLKFSLCFSGTSFYHNYEFCFTIIVL